MIDLAEAEEAIGSPIKDWFAKCHYVSLGIIQAGLAPEGSRVARGWADGVASQHSWIVVGDPYGMDSPIIDPTLWSWRSKEMRGKWEIWYGTMRDDVHRPHGFGDIFNAGRPEHQGGETIALEGELSAEALEFLDSIGPLDYGGWMVLFSSLPVGGWPAAEIYAAADDHPLISAAIPIDRLGMLTDRNPGGLYF